jgi:hypothetical protein
MWKLILLRGMFFALIAVSAASAQIPAQVQVQRPVRAQVQDSAAAPITDNELKMARFFAGVALIRSAAFVNDTGAARFYRELEAVCGVTGKDASAFLERCRSNPAAWKRINDLTIPLLTELSATIPEAPPPKAAFRAADRKRGKLWAGQ